MRIGIICPAEIAMRRFMPALQYVSELEFAGVGMYSRAERFAHSAVPREQVECIMAREREKVRSFLSLYGGQLYDSYQAVVEADDLAAVYIPLPPALHFIWAKKALMAGKHVIVEKPATISVHEADVLLELARKHGLVLHENYMFMFHAQLKAIAHMLAEGRIGEVRLIRLAFGFPRRAEGDFRYQATLGGGALLDAGGYVLKYAAHLLGNTARIVSAQMNYVKNVNVDMYGSGMLVNADGLTAQIAFGMDNEYKCELEVWGSKGTLHTGRVLTAPAGFVPQVTLCCHGQKEVLDLPADDAFRKSLEHFVISTKDAVKRCKNYDDIKKQAALVERFCELAGRNS